jgi:hypothetical protein
MNIKVEFRKEGRCYADGFDGEEMRPQAQQCKWTGDTGKG